MSVDLKGNTNYTTLKNLDKNIIVPRTSLSAIDLNVGLGIDVSGDTIAVKAATTDEIISGTSNRVVTADALKPIIDTIPEALTEGAGIDITSGTVSVALTAGDLMSINGATVSRLREMNIVNEANMDTRTITAGGASKTALVLTPGDAYKISAVNADKYLATSADWKTSTSKWGLEGHIELFVAGTGRVHTDTNVHLTNALEPDAVNNCTVRFHDGMALISVEDHIAGEVVIVQGGTTKGSLYYAIQTSNQEYVAFDAVLDGLVIDIGGSTANGEKHLVGNGYTSTTLTGTITCGANKVTAANLALSDVGIKGGTMTLGDVFIPSGSTVAVSGGGLAIEKVTGDGETSVINLGLTNINVSSDATVSGCTISGGRATNGGAMLVSKGKSADVTSCVFASNSATGSGGAVYNLFGTVNLTGCTFANNYSPVYGLAVLNTGGDVYLNGCAFGAGQSVTNAGAGATTIVSGSCAVGGTLAKYGTYGTLLISAGAIIDATGNTNNTIVIQSAGGCKVGSGTPDNWVVNGSAKFINSAGAEIDLSGTFTSITKAGVVS